MHAHYPIGVALGVLFDGMLDTWQNLDHFLAPSDPCAFIVYAHQNDDYGNSHADCVVLLIQWLKKIHARIISDKWPSLTYVDRDGGDAPTCNIVANQICLLPSSDLQDEHQPVRSVTKVVLCSSETLRIYYGHEFTAPYIRRIKEAYSEAKKQGLGFEHLQQNINLVVEDCHQKPGFHHVLTELAFLEIRNSSTSTGNTGESDIIKVCLDNKSPDYMPFAGSPTDVELLLESSNGLTALHRLFFKLLRRLSPKNGEQIGIIQHEYQTAASRILGGTVSTEGNVRQLASDTFDKAVVTIRNLLQAHTRSLGRLRTELLSPENTRNTALAQGAESGNVAIIPQLPTEYTVMMRKDRETAFVDATRNGHLDAVQSLLEQGARLDSTDDQGRAGLSRAARGGHCEVVRVLLEKGASIDLTDNDGRAALSQAAGYGHCAVVGVLLEKGASTDWR
ncbi:hypothetical protein F5B20DRAFT_373565 [Whalleya microplaca]|nr:hypothetical protein F5B20DRAFT_373565 [Whalleya microplaca]